MFNVLLPFFFQSKQHIIDTSLTCHLIKSKCELSYRNRSECHVSTLDFVELGR